jgi:hypothetical protein
MRKGKASDAMGPSRHRRQHDEFVDAEVEVDGARMAVKRVATQTPLDRYANRRLIDRRQYEAGERLARDWHHARMAPRLVATYGDLIDCGGIPDPAADRAHARRRVAQAVAAVGRIAANEVVSVCCLEHPVGGHAAMEILRRGLDVLADHYGF